MFVRRHGAVVLNVDYRLSPEHPFPVPVNDSWDVLKWASEHYAEVNADPSKGFVIGGTSAGGNISAVLGFKARDEKLSPPLTGLLLTIPAIGLNYKAIPAEYKDDILSYAQNAEAPILPLPVIDRFMDAFKPDYTSRLHNLFADPVDWSGVPPTVFQICGLDPLRDEAFLAEKKMREAGVKTLVDVYPGLPHAFWSFLPKWGPSQEFVKHTADTMGWLLEQGGK
ncbi:Alpha/beta hydrolase fold-3 [Eremomyces bilateralis CBS 781.70]|uniref:Alpha/beta hydrolase fold-3 n=1 Tax=Eremomyces bilateralis CBS 781.70 TaxID=1392243 RepID=A0A6G1GBY8_9PEZI|nr:Alpha/beta hydrolase fold-3 [Eremomyces bilateralis CBS 781.70]KAF1815605.1 Alpha/beta hydrolase fold-3 [Eremomyces bilateralis CBS 781.70]